MKQVPLITKDNDKQHLVEEGDRFIYGIGKYPSPTEGILNEISPSGDFVKINDDWHYRTSVTLYELLPTID